MTALRSEDVNPRASFLLLQLSSNEFHTAVGLTLYPFLAKIDR